MPEFYIKIAIARKYFFPFFFWGGGHVHHWTPISYAYGQRFNNNGVFYECCRIYIPGLKHGSWLVAEVRQGEVSMGTDVGNLDARQYTASEASKYGGAWTFMCLCGQKDAAGTTACGHGTATGRGDTGSSTVHAPPAAAGTTHRWRCGTPEHMDAGTHPWSGALATFEGLLWWSEQFQVAIIDHCYLMDGLRQQLSRRSLKANNWITRRRQNYFCVVLCRSSGFLYIKRKKSNFVVPYRSLNPAPRTSDHVAESRHKMVAYFQDRRRPANLVSSDWCWHDRDEDDRELSHVSDQSTRPTNDRSDAGSE